MQYRPEVDGLRAIAVVPVILFHAGVELFRGGYVGVDIFFVISGYLITSILISELASGNFSLVRFYARRAKRILPALFFVMLVCVPIAWSIMLPSEFKDFSQSLVAVTLFASNILFWVESDYFAVASELKPLLHTWSLAVEEQYYMFFPLLLLFTWKFGRPKVVLIIVMIALLSLAASEWAWRNAPSANFYLAPTRVWELLAGTLCAFFPNVGRNKSRDFLALIGFLMILASVFLYSEDTPFPSVYTLLPVTGCALVILFAKQGTWVAGLLSHQFFVGVGLISYSLYLWHQPLFAFARLRSPIEPSAWVMTALTLATIGLAYMTWRFVENPFRAPKISNRRIFSFSLVAGLAFMGLGVIGHATNGSPIGDGYSPAQRDILAFSKYESARLYQEGECFLETAQTPSDLKEFCATAEDQMIVVGDSHAAALSVGLRGVYDTGQLTAHGCPPLLGYSSLSQPNCNQTMDYFLKEVGRLAPKFIILHANWEAHVGKEIDRVEATLAQLRNAAPESRILIVGGVPTWSPSLPASLVRGRVEISQPGLIFSDTQDNRSADVFLNKISKDGGAEFVSLIDLLCEIDICRSLVGDHSNPVPLVWDYGHLTKEGSDYITNEILAQKLALEQALK